MTDLLPSYARLEPLVRRWSPLRAYLNTTLLLLAIFAWAPLWMWAGGQRSLVSFTGQLQFSGLMVFLTAPLSAVPIAWHLRRAADGSPSLPAVFVVLKVTIVLVSAAVFLAVSAGAPDARLAARELLWPRTQAFLMVGVALSIPLGAIYGCAFQALLGVWARAAERPAGR